MNTFERLQAQMKNMSNSETDFLSIENATVRHLEKVLFESLTFHVQKGQQWAILGNSGSGKSALLQTILGNFNITNGKIHYSYFSYFKKAHAITDPLFSNRKLIALVDQQPHFKNKQNMKEFFYQQRFHSWFAEEAHTVEEYLKDQVEKVGLNTWDKELRFPLDWVIENLQLAHLLHKTLIQLSNGETRRLMIAYALLQQPLLLMMDNPFIGLDTASRPILDQLLEKIIQKDTQILLSTTSREIPHCTTHIALLDQGKIMYAGPKAEFKIPSQNADPSLIWHPDPVIIENIKKREPKQDHSFKNALKMKNIHVRYGNNYILEAIDWEVKKGEKWALLGPNGAGKSTLLSLMSGDHPQAYSNTIYLFDHKRGSGESIWDLKHRIGFVSPEMHQYFSGNGNCMEVILSGLDDTMGFRGKLTDEKENQLALNWLRLLELEHLKEIRFKDTATGEQRLLLLIRALIKNPPLLLLDEPCQGLDAIQRDHFKHIINLLWDKGNKTLIYVSHYKEDIPTCVNQVLQLENGRIS